MTDRTKLIGLALGLWLALEILAFAFVLRAIGLLAAILLGLGTTALGLADVKGLLAVWRERGKWRAEGAMLDGAIQAFASFLLILPGFASDVAGLALKSPSVRSAVLDRIRNRGKGPDKPGGPSTIDLAPHEWKHLTKSGRPKRKRKKPDEGGKSGDWRRE
ncbi:FxsA family protein [Methylocystis iwaonis]|uniref:FxsA family protein n=1 Tax=Methylocystis iwaonis TaxID=2885079 RepID=UPI002E7B3682|nr:FxsA family protein [Methylocystis iwaonis]